MLAQSTPPKCFTTPTCYIKIDVHNKIVQMAVELGFYRFSVQGMNTRSPIAILHGVFGSKNNWRSVGKRLAQETGRPVSTRLL